MNFSGKIRHVARQRTVPSARCIVPEQLQSKHMIWTDHGQTKRKFNKMNTQLSKTAVLVALITILISCNQGTKTRENEGTPATKEEPPIITHVMTKEAQAKLMPDEVLKEFKEGNQRFNSGTKTLRDHSEQIRKSAEGQFPKAVVISCLDSRVPVEDVFDQGIGDIFVGRVAGNFINEDLLGSIEFACKVAGAKLVFILGHQHCGAVKGAIDDVQLGNMTAMLSKIKPAVAMSQDFQGEKTSKNDAFVKYVSENNVRLAIKQIRERSPILKEMEDKGKIKIVGAYYNLTDGTLEFVE